MTWLAIERELFIPASVRDRSRSTPLFEDIHESATMLHIINQCNQTIARFEKLSYLHHQWRSFSKYNIILRMYLLLDLLEIV